MIHFLRRAAFHVAAMAFVFVITNLPGLCSLAVDYARYRATPDKAGHVKRLLGEHIKDRINQRRCFP